MAGIVTQTYFAKDVYSKLNKKIIRKIDYDTFVTFSQGPDVFNYRKINSKKTKNFSLLVHEVNTKEFICSYIKYIKKYRLEKNEEILASLYGYISHYILDINLNPFIYYKTGIYKKNNPSTYKYKGKLNEMNQLIDSYLIEKRGDNKKLANMCIPKTKYSYPLINLLNTLYLDNYKLENMGQFYIYALKDMKWYIRIFKQDKRGYKYKIYKFISKFIKSKKRELNSLSSASKLREKTDYINYKHKYWFHPMNKDEASNAHFFELYKKAITEVVELIKIIDKYIETDDNIKKIIDYIPDVSLISAKSPFYKGEMRYFEK